LTDTHLVPHAIISSHCSTISAQYSITSNQVKLTVQPETYGPTEWTPSFKNCSL